MAADGSDQQPRPGPASEPVDEIEEVEELEVVEPVDPPAGVTDVAEVEIVAVESHEIEEPLELAGVDVFTTERSAEFDQDDQTYVSDLLKGMLELDMDRLRLKRGKALPYFGFLTDRPARCSYDGILRYIGHVIRVPEQELSWGAEGVLRVSAGGDGAVMQLLFGVEIGPRAAWIRFTRDVEERVLRKAPGG